jgi:FkbM family methyltransferase
MRAVLRGIKNRIVELFKPREQDVFDINFNGEGLILSASIINASEPVVIFDVGANIGEYSLHALQLLTEYEKAFELHLFEPQKYNSVILNNVFVQRSNVVLNDFGLSDKTGNSTLFSEEQGSTSASIYNREFFRQENYSVDSEEIKLKTLEEYISGKHLKKIDFIKIDVEGHEMAVIKGMGRYLSSGVIRAIQFEYGGTYLDAGTRLKDIYDILSPHFNIGKILPTGVSYQQYTEQLEDFNYSNYLAVFKI